MIQVNSFELPSQQKEANEFLATHKPAGDTSFNKDRLFVFWDDGTWPVEYEIACLQELIQGQRNARIQQQIALFVAKGELAETPTNMARYDELAKMIKELEKALDLQENKINFVQQRIDQLRNGNK